MADLGDALTPIAVNERFVVINKAAGVSFHQEDGVPGVAERARHMLGLDVLHAVHRLDKVTSGLLLLARDTHTARELGQAFEQHRIEKRYLALASKAPLKKQGWIRGDMHKGRNGLWRLARTREQEAITWFISRGLGQTPVEMLPPDFSPEQLRLFLLRPFTGRTHQLRVAMKSLGSPIIGDTAYGGRPASRTCLHAWQLAFTLDDEQHRFVSPLPADSLFSLPVLEDVLADWEQLRLPPSPLSALSFTPSIAVSG